MVCTANDLLEWSDFPKGLRVLLLDEDPVSSAEIKSGLERMDYIVSTFCNEDEALAAVSNTSHAFHVAIVEMSTGDSHGRFKFLEAAKDLPTIMTSNVQCLSTMMRCIALGAAEFISKPLSEDKLKNLWQHVVHKAFNAGGKSLPKSLKPDKESVLPTLSPRSEDLETKSNLLIKNGENDREHSTGSDRYPAPPTPQLKHGVRSLDDGDGQDRTICLTDNENGDEDGESKFVDTTSCDLDDEVRIETGPPPGTEGATVQDEDPRHDNCRSENKLLPPSDYGSGQGRSGVHDSGGKRATQKKMKVDWTPELHKKFVQAVEKLGVDQAIPSRILELMKTEGLTRHNIASHLQKYRMQRRHIMPREDERRWPYRRDMSQRSYYPQRPLVAYPPYQNEPMYPPWGPHGSYFSGFQMCRPAFYPLWQPADYWSQKQYPGMHADAWGCPVMPPPQGPCHPAPQNVNGFYGTNAVQNIHTVPQDPSELNLAEEVVDRMVKEAMSKPWLPLPIGLKPPSTDSVLSELSKQGIPTVPPRHVVNRSPHCQRGPPYGSHNP